MDTEPVVPPVPEPAEPAVAPPHRGAVVVLALTAGLAAGLLAWLAGEALFEFVPPTKELVVMMGQRMMQPTGRTISVADTRNAAIAFGIFGGLFGLALGIAGGLARRSPGAAGGAGLGGLILGGLTGAGLALLVVPMIFRLSQGSETPAWLDPGGMILPMLIHGAIWCPIGAVGGLALGLGLGLRPLSVLRVVLGGLLGAALGTVIFEGVGAGLFPLAKTTEPIAASLWARLLARVLIAVLAALGAAREAVARRAP